MIKDKPRNKFRLDPAIWFLFVGFLGFILFYIWPFLVSLAYSFMDKPVGGIFAGLRNYIDLFQNKPYLSGLANTGTLAGISVPLNVALSLAVALLIKRTPKHRELFVLLFLIPLVIPSGSMVSFWKAVFDHNGYINGLLYSLGLDKINWLESGNARFVMILIFIWKNLGYNMVLFLSGLNSISKDYYEAAYIDGAGAWTAFWRITVPQLMPMLVLVVIMSLINAFKVFKEIYLITGSYPHESIYTLQHFMNNMFRALNYPKLTSATTVLVLMMAAFSQGLLRFERKVSL